MSYENRHWVIMSWPQPQEAWDAVLENPNTCRKSLDDTKVLMKWDGDTHSYFAGETTYTHSEILAILAGPEWTEPMPDPPEDP